MIDFNDIKRRAQGRWQSVLSSVGIDAAALDGKHHPCPCKGEGKDRFRFADKGCGRFHCHCNNGSGDGFDLICCLTGCKPIDAFRAVAELVDVAQPTPPKPRTDPSKRLRATWAKSHTPGMAVHRYLKSRALTAVPAVREARIDYYEDGQRVGTYPAMLALVHDTEGPLTLHCTHLTDDGSKAPVVSPKKLLPALRPMSNFWIPLTDEGNHLFVAEGIETALSAIPLFQARAVYSLVSTHGLKTFDLPARFERLTILADNDQSFAGQKAAYELAERMQRRAEVEVLTPDEPGDFNDVLMRRAA